jgi:hypothetical protein
MTKVHSIDMTPNFSITGIPQIGSERAINTGGNLCSGGGDTYWLLEDGTSVPLTGARDTANYAHSPNPRNGTETPAPEGAVALVSYSWDTINGRRQFLSVQTDRANAIRVAHLLAKKYEYDLVLTTLSHWGGYWGRAIATVISGTLPDWKYYRGPRSLRKIWREMCRYTDGWQGIFPEATRRNLPVTA